MGCQISVEVSIFISEELLVQVKNIFNELNCDIRECNDSFGDVKEFLLIFELKEKELLDVNEQLLDLHNLLNKNIINFVISNKLETKIDIVVSISDGDVPAFNLDRKFLKLANTLNAEIDIDLYVTN